ncbi:MAG: hypothetical protein AAF909_08770 [Pseudomonadota bacterium]
MAATPVELWISLFPTAPLFGIRWFFADAADAAETAIDDAIETILPPEPTTRPVAPAP